MIRKSGVLLSVTSLPSRYGIGCFSESAYRFIDYLAQSGQTYWQILPLGFTSRKGADSPYQAYSAFAGNPYLISLEQLVEEGVLRQEECDSLDFGGNPEKVDYHKLHLLRRGILRKAYERSRVTENLKFLQYVGENSWWLDDFALFMALKEFFDGVPWQKWPQDIRMRWENALSYYREKLYFEIEFHKYLQYQFFTQWQAVKNYAAQKNIEILGDLPIYVSADSADVWAHPELFQMDEENVCTRVAGCPPDAFTPDGQLWGNPLYNWQYHEKTGYQWWITRMWYSYQLFDVVRIDHFRGFDQYYSIPAESKTAKTGTWEQGPGKAFFDALEQALGKRSVIAEDLGFMTGSVRELVKSTGFPNMKVLEFAFDPQDTEGCNDHLPHNYSPNCVVYTGTHDNMTLSGWYHSLKKEEKTCVKTYLGSEKIPDREVPSCLLALAMGSGAETCILPMQDILGLPNKSRMNTPGTVKGNWQWRLTQQQFRELDSRKLLELTCRYGRANGKNILLKGLKDPELSENQEK